MKCLEIIYKIKIFFDDKMCRLFLLKLKYKKNNNVKQGKTDEKL